MTGFMPRSCFEPGGFVYEFHGGNCRQLAPNVAGREKRTRSRFDDGEWHDVTWDEIMERRRLRQAEIMERRLRPAEPTVLPCYVWTFFISGFPFGGWHCYIVTRRFGDISLSFYRRRPSHYMEVAEQVMRAFPCGLLPLAENFETWMAAFAKRYPRSRNWPGGKVLHHGEHDPRMAGLAYGWLTDRRTFSLQRPQS